MIVTGMIENDDLRETNLRDLFTFLPGIAREGRQLRYGFGRATGLGQPGRTRLWTLSSVSHTRTCPPAHYPTPALMARELSKLR